jgi:hypothetical protein
MPLSGWNCKYKKQSAEGRKVFESYIGLFAQL